jgi:hypothetical protein
LSSSTVLFLEKLKSFLDSIGLTFEEFFTSFQSSNKNQLSRLEFFRIITLIHIETYNNFDSQLVFEQLSHKNETISLSDLNKIMNAVGKSYD